MNLGLILAFALTVNEPNLVHCSATLPSHTTHCTASTPVNWNQAKRLTFELNRTAGDKQKWHLASPDQLADAKLRCDASSTAAERWWMTSDFLKHGDEILVGAYDCQTDKTEFMPVTQPLKLLLVR